MAGLLDFLFGGAQAASQAPQAGHSWGYDKDGYLTQIPNGGGAMPTPQMPQAPAPGAAVQQAAQQAPAMPLVQSSQTPQAAPEQDPITIQGDNWKPKKAGILGQIADYLLDTHFGKNTVRQNQEGALEHLTSNPMEAVRRMAKFDPEGAQALYHSVMREQHQEAGEKHQSDVYENMAENQAMSVARNMASVATPENSAAVHAQILKYLTAKGVDPALIDTIPDESGSIDDFKTFAQGGVPAGRQAALLEQARNHNLQHGDRAASLSERGAFHRGLLGQGAERIGISQGNLDERREHDDVIETQGQERVDNRPGHMTSVMTPAGPALIDPTGNVLHLKRGGKTYTYIKGGSKDGKINWVPTGEVK